MQWESEKDILEIMKIEKKEATMDWKESKAVTKGGTRSEPDGEKTDETGRLCSK